MPVIDFRNINEVWYGGQQIAEVWYMGEKVWEKRPSGAWELLYEGLLPLDSLVMFTRSRTRYSKIKVVYDGETAEIPIDHRDIFYISDAMFRSDYNGESMGLYRWTGANTVTQIYGLTV